MSQDDEEVQRNGNGFEDIEMLNIPSDDSMSEKHDSDSSHLSHDDDLALFPLSGQYCRLADWLKDPDALKFEFDAEQYQNSHHLCDAQSRAYFDYINSLYKAIEVLSSNGITRVAIDLEENPAISLEKLSQVDCAFDKIVESHRTRLDAITPQTESYDKIAAASAILECLQANLFCPDLRYKPEKIAEWINRFDPKPYLEITQEVMLSECPFTHPEFLNTYMTQLVTRGLTTEAANALANSRYDALRETCPQLYEVIVGLQELLAEYRLFALKGNFRQWKMAVCEFRELLPSVASLEESLDSDRATLAQIRDLVYILSGYAKTIALSCSTWYEVYTALLLYDVRDDDTLYSEFFHTARSLKPTPVNTDTSDVFIQAESCFVYIMEHKFVNVLGILFAIEPATAAFVAKVLEIKGFLCEYYTEAVKDSDVESLAHRRTVSEYFLTVFAYECLNIHSLAPVGIGLLLNDDITASGPSRESAVRVLQDYLPRYECQTNDDLEWLLTICAKTQTRSTAIELYYRRGQQSLDQGLLYEALNMFVNCYDPAYSLDQENKGMKQIHAIVWDTIFADSLLNCRPAMDELVNDIVSGGVDGDFEIHPVLRQCLAPYAVLCQYYTSWQLGPGEYSKKLSKLNHLLRFQHLPRKFMPLLLCQFIPFLLEPHFTLLLPELIIIIELIDLLNASITAQEQAMGEELYRYCLENYEGHDHDHDWRVVLKRHKVEAPVSVVEMVRFLRDKITAKIGQVYVRS